MLVVFLALASVACGSYVPLAQPAHHAALVLDPHGRPLDTAEVINARAIHLQAKALEGHGALVHAAAPVAIAPVAHSVVAAPAVVAVPAAVSHQSRVDIRTSPAYVTAHATPVLAAHSAYAPLLGHSAHGLAAHGLAAHGLAAHGHLLQKRSLGHISYAAPVITHSIAPAAVSHQSRVDVHTSPASVSHAYAAPVVAHAVAPVVAHAIAPAAVSHQSRVDVRTSPAVVAHAAIAPVAHAVVAAPLAHIAAPIHGINSGYAYAGHGHLLKKRSLGHVIAPVAIAHAPAAVSHQSRVDVVSRPAIVTHTVTAPVLAHAAVVSHAAPIVPVAHSALLSHSVHSAPLAYATHW